jgi:hypothetical protein
LILGEAVDDRQQKVRVRVRRRGAKEPDYEHRRLLRTRLKRPHNRRAAKQGDELAPFQLIELHSVPCQPDCTLPDFSVGR